MKMALLFSLFSSAVFPGILLTSIPQTGFTDLYSLSLNGTTQYLNCGTALNTDYQTTPLTVGAWIFVTSSTAPGPILDSTNDTYRGIDFTTTGGVHNGDVELYLINSYGGNVLLNNTDANIFTVNTWTHVVATYSGTIGPSAIKFYVNGSSVTSTNHFNTLSGTTLSTGTFRIGQSTLQGDTFPGKIDEAFIINGTALSAGQVNAIYNAGVPASLAAYTPTSWWRFENNLNDASGGNDCTGVNSPTFSSSVP